MERIATIEQQTQRNPIDEELKAVETEPHLEDRAFLTRVLLEDLYFGFSELRNKAMRMKGLRKEHPSPESGFHRFLLADISGGMKLTGNYKEAMRQLLSIREFNDKVDYERTTANAFVQIHQGNMWLTPATNPSPYHFAGMSECSFITAKTPTNQIVSAHLSYSMELQLDQVLEFLGQQGVTPDQVFGIVSVGDYQKDKAVGRYDRVASIDDYVRRGFDPKKLIDFSWRAEKDDSGLRVDRSLTYALVGPNFLHKYSVDARTQWTGWGYRSQPISEFYDVRTLEF